MAPAHAHPTERLSRIQLAVSDYIEAADQAGFALILSKLAPPSKTGRPPLPREPLIKLFLLSQRRKPYLPRNATQLLELLKNDHGLATQCGFDRIPSRSTVRNVLTELSGLKNEVRIAQAEITRLLKGKSGKPQRETRGKPKAIAKGRKPKHRRERRRSPKKAEHYRKRRLDHAMGVFQFEKTFPDDKAAEAFIVYARWPDGVVTCPEPDCGSKDVVGTRRSKQRTWRCRQCRRSFHALTCTTLQGVHGSWRTILLAVYYTLQFPYESSLSLACALKTSERKMAYKTALRLRHRILQGLDEDLPQSSGDCQIDDTLIGNVNGIPITVIGCVDTETGQVRGDVIVGEVALHNSSAFIQGAITRDACLLTDDTDKYSHSIRNRLTVNHSRKQYSRWDDEHQKLVTTNSIESFWSTLKFLLSIHRAVTLRHLPLYVAAAAWHISHQSKPTVDQMQNFFRNAHAAYIRPAKEIPDSLLDFQLDLQPFRHSTAPESYIEELPRAA